MVHVHMFVCVIITQFGVSWIKKVFQTSHVACVWDMSKIVDSGIFSFILKLLDHGFFFKEITIFSYKNKHISVGLQNLYSLFPGRTTVLKMHWGVSVYGTAIMWNHNHFRLINA